MTVAITSTVDLSDAKKIIEQMLHTDWDTKQIVSAASKAPPPPPPQKKSIPSFSKENVHNIWNFAFNGFQAFVDS